MKLVRNSLLGLLLIAGAAAAAVDSALLNLVPSDAKILSGIQVDQSRSSKFGQYVLSQMSTTDPGFLKFIVETGFDPRRDLTEILVATSGSTATPSIVAVGRGVFNPAKITAASTAAGATSSTYNGIALITDAVHGEDHALGFLDTTIAVIGNTAAVKAVIDQRTSGPKLDQATQDKVRSLAAVNDAWFLSTVPVTDFLAGKLGGTDMNQAAGGGLLQAILSANGGVKFSSTGINISGEALTRSSQDATALADVLRFIAGLVKQNQGTSPQAQTAASLLDSLQLTTTASTLKVALTIPEDVAEKLFMPNQKGPAAARHRRVASLR